MAHASSKEKSSAREKTLDRILNIPGVVGEPIWRELADEAEVYLKLYKRLSQEPLDSPEREALEDKMILSLAHLSTHSRVLYDSVDAAIELGFFEETETKLSPNSTSEVEFEKDLSDHLNDFLASQERITDFLKNFADESKKMKDHFSDTVAETKEAEKIGDIKAKVARLNAISNRLTSAITIYSGQLQQGLSNLRQDIALFLVSCSAVISSVSVISSDNKNNQAAQTLESSLKELKQSIKLGNLEELRGVMQAASHNKKLSAALRKATANLESRILVFQDALREVDAFADEELGKLK